MSSGGVNSPQRSRKDFDPFGPRQIHPGEAHGRQSPKGVPDIRKVGMGRLRIHLIIQCTGLGQPKRI